MLKILLVEDEAAVADFMKTGLQEEGFQVRHETDGLDGLQAAYEQPFDLIILDIILPRKNGLEICK
ncbi:MAG TPA: response regulator, partial [Saprospiraceae bacterium]|nr:response regulator [Saprospiraceae bacterium]